MLASWSEEKFFGVLKAALREELSDVTVRLTRLEGGQLLLQQDVSALKEDVSDLKEDVSDLKEDVSDLKEDVSALKHDVSALKHDVSALKHDVSALKQDVSALNQQVITIDLRLSELGVILESHDVKFSKVIEMVDTLTGDNKLVKILDFEVGYQRGSMAVIDAAVAKHLADKSIHLPEARSETTIL